MDKKLPKILLLKIFPITSLFFSILALFSVLSSGVYAVCSCEGSNRPTCGNCVCQAFNPPGNCAANLNYDHLICGYTNCCDHDAAGNCIAGVSYFCGCDEAPPPPAATSTPTPMPTACPAECIYTETNQTSINTLCVSYGYSCSAPNTWANLTCHSGVSCPSWKNFGTGCTSPFCTGCVCLTPTPTPTLPGCGQRCTSTCQGGLFCSGAGYCCKDCGAGNFADCSPPCNCALPTNMPTSALIPTATRRPASTSTPTNTPTTVPTATPTIALACYALNCGHGRVCSCTSPANCTCNAYGGTTRCDNLACQGQTNCVCPLPTDIPVNTPTATSIPPTNTPTGRPTNIPARRPTNTPTNVTTKVPTNTLVPTATPLPTSSQLCCLKESGSLASHCWEQGASYSGGVYWPGGVPCEQYCSGGSMPGTWCGSGPSPACRSCKCGNNGSLNPPSFNIGPGETKTLTASYVPGSSTNPGSISYKWYAFPFFNKGQGKEIAECDNCQIGYRAVNLEEWSWSEFIPSDSGYLASVEMLINSKTDGYASAFVAEYKNGQIVRLSDSRGEGETGGGGYEDEAQLYGARERYFAAGEKKYLFDFDYLNQYVSAGTTYRLYFKPRSAEKFDLNSFWIYVYPSNKLEVGSFSDPSGCRGQTQCTVTYTAPLTVPIGTTFKILAEISDDKSLFANSCGSGNCLSQAIIGPSAASGWFQTKDIDVYSGGDIKSSIPSTAIPNSYFSLKGEGGSPGVIVSKPSSANIDFGDKGQDPSERHWLARGAPYQGKIINFDYLVNRLKINTTVKDFPHGCSPISGTYYAEGEQAVDCDWNIHSGTKIVVFVNAGVTINNNITVEQGGFLAIIAKGDITFGGNVVKAQGLFVSSQNLVINGSTVSPHHAFEGRGSFIGWKGIQLNRNLETGRSKTDPSELFMARPDLWLNFPQEFSYSLSIREEMAP